MRGSRGRCESNTSLKDRCNQERKGPRLFRGGLQQTGPLDPTRTNRSGAPVVVARVFRPEGSDTSCHRSLEILMSVKSGRDCPD